MKQSITGACQEKTKLRHLQVLGADKREINTLGQEHKTGNPARKMTVG